MTQPAAEYTTLEILASQTAHRQSHRLAPALAWRHHADALAHWAWDHLTNRTDVWGAYLPLAERGKTRADGTKFERSWTAPAVKQRGIATLTRDVLRRHFAGQIVEHVIGLHSTSADNTSRWGAVDIDWHGPTSTAPSINLDAAMAWYERGRELGFAPLLTESNGEGGYHLRFVFVEPVPTPRVYAYLQWLTRDHAVHGMTEPEIFPKQLRIKPGGFGNWLRLPGRHHTRDHWSRLWDGDNWLEGAEAVEYILGLRGDSPDLIPVDAPPPPTSTPRRRIISTSWQVGGTAASASGMIDDELSARIARYMAALPHLGEGQGRDDVGYGFAAFLVRDLQVSDSDALVWLMTWDSHNHPPKGETCCRKWIASAHLYGTRPYGCGLVVRERPQRRHKATVVRCEMEVC